MINRQVNYFASVKLLALLLCTLTFLHSAIAQEGSQKRELPESAYQPGDKWWVPPVNLSVPNATYQIFKSKEVGQEVGYVEYLPPNYHEDEEARFPVMYWLPSLRSGPAQCQLAIDTYSTAIESGDIPPFIIIGCNGMVDSWYIDSEDGRYPVETVIVKDLITHVDATRRTIAKKDGRMVAGFSMGGYGAMRLGLKYPEVFGAVGAMGSGRFDKQASPVGLRKPGTPAQSEEDRQNMQRFTDSGPLRVHSAQHVAANSAVVLLDQNLERIKEAGLRILIAVGDRDWHLEGAQLFGSLLKEKGVDSRLIVALETGHRGSRVLEYAMPGTTEFLNELWRSPVEQDKQ